jgi:hypothetical protein
MGAETNDLENNKIEKYFFEKINKHGQISNNSNLRKIK